MATNNDDSVKLSGETFEAMAKVFKVVSKMESDEYATEIGKVIAEALELKADSQGRYKTINGEKTSAGLARVVFSKVFN